MDRLQQRLQSAERALTVLREVAEIENPTDIERDAAIQRFEFTFEASWKAASKEILIKNTRYFKGKRRKEMKDSGKPIH